MIRQCNICGKDFKATIYAVKHGGGKFCSNKCRAKWQKENTAGDKSPRWIAKMEIACGLCGNKIQVHKSSLKRGEGKFCSIACARIATGKKRMGPNNFRWKGGITSVNQQIRDSITYNNWRSRIFKRDSFTCQECGDTTSGNLNAHHLLPFSKFPQFRFDPWNGITLCKCCHASVHAQKIKVGVAHNG